MCRSLRTNRELSDDPRLGCATARLGHDGDKPIQEDLDQAAMKSKSR